MGLKDANIGRSFAELGRRLRLMVDRALVRIVTDSLGRQNLQVQSLADETNDDVER
ncbi:phage baseplate assembly protein, partial [Klebsiella pneumoniae]|uniref:phage baseplate assembly protein domain-containing protein n=3 Tax=Klebsiella/Raoultella group TaxID=2890311 RepID=UPI0011E4B96A